jgi:hypothetical protein
MPLKRANSKRSAKLARQIVRAAHKLTKLKRPPCWVSFYDVVRVVGSADDETITGIGTHVGNVINTDKPPDTVPVQSPET